MRIFSWVSFGRNPLSSSTAPGNGNDYFGARYYSNRYGRWLSADWSSTPVAIPYANLANPQTLNLYSMVADDPESFADLDGHCDPEMVCPPDETLPDAKTTKEVLKGAGKELINAGISTLNSFSSVDAPGLGDPTVPSGIPLLTPSNSTQEAGMAGTAGMIIGLSAASLFADLANAMQARLFDGPSEPYNRQKHYGNTPTNADRKAIGGESVDHDPPLVQRYYEGDPAKGEQAGFRQTPEQRKASANDRTRMKPSTKKEQKAQGGKMAQYSKKKKKEHGLDSTSTQ